MARNHATIYTSIWDVDSRFRDLTAGAQFAYLKLLSQPSVSLVGVLRLDWRNWARQARDGEPAALQAAVDELEDEAYVAVDHDTEELWIRSYLFHDRVFRQSQVAMAAASAFRSVQSVRLRDLIRASVPPGVREVWPDGLVGAKRDEVTRLLKDTEAADWRPQAVLTPVREPRRFTPNARGKPESESPLEPPLALGLGGVGVGVGGGVGGLKASLDTSSSSSSDLRESHGGRR